MEYNENQTMEEFLRDRGLEENYLKFLRDERIDSSTILLMSEDQLKKYFPKYEDRIALINFCKKQNSGTKKSLIEKLKLKMTGTTGKEKPYSPSKLRKKKDTRKIEFGWVCMGVKDNILRQVRTKFGGGTRRVSVDKDLKCDEILKMAVELFFPAGISVKGPLEHFTTELLDYKHHKCSFDLTVEEMYNISALTSLRFYLATTYTEGHKMNDNIEHYVPATVTSINEQESVVRRSARLEAQQTFPADQKQEAQSLVNYVESFTDSDFNDFQNANPNEDYSVYNLDENNIYQLPDLPITTSLEEEPPGTTEKLILHRGNVFYELLDVVKNRNVNFAQVQIEMILPNGKSEPAENVGGVLRDSISDFFSTFYELCTMGTDFKVPSLRHNFQQEEWSAIGRIIVQSFLVEKYFPIKVAPVFIKYCLGYTLDDNEILENFLKYVSNSDAALFKIAIDDFDNVDQDDLLEVLSNYDAKWVPNKDNFKKLLQQIAQEELLQKPSFVKECFSVAFKELKCIIDLNDIYTKLKPTDKNIINLFNVDDNLPSEKAEIVKYLKKFIKESDEKTKAFFLRYCTGSDLANKNIKIEFINSEGFSRVPMAHTCSGLLQLPTSYENFISFRSEFNNLLNSNIWVMDIV